MNDQIKTREIVITGNFSHSDFKELFVVLLAFQENALKRGTCLYIAMDFEPAENERNGKKQPDSGLIE